MGKLFGHTQLHWVNLLKRLSPWIALPVMIYINAWALRGVDVQLRVSNMRDRLVEGAPKLVDWYKEKRAAPVALALKKEAAAMKKDGKLADEARYDEALKFVEDKEWIKAKQAFKAVKEEAEQKRIEEDPRDWDNLNCTDDFSSECYKSSNFKLSLFFIICSVIVLIVCLYLIYHRALRVAGANSAYSIAKDIKHRKKPNLEDGTGAAEAAAAKKISDKAWKARFDLRMDLALLMLVTISSLYSIYYFYNDYDNDNVKTLLGWWEKYL